jgi:hypothetical protein
MDWTHLLAAMIGGVVATVAFALCSIASDADDRMEQEHDRWPR